MTFTKLWYQYYRKHLEVDETGAAKTYWKDNISSGPCQCITIHLAEIWGHIKQKKGSSNYLRLYHQYIGTCKMINMLRKGIKFSIQRVYFPQSYFESRHYVKRFNSIGKFKSLTFQLRAIYFHTFAVDMSVLRPSVYCDYVKFPFNCFSYFSRPTSFLQKSSGKS